MSFFGVSGINHFLENQSSLNGFIKGIGLVIFIVLIGLIFLKLIQYTRKSTYVKIKRNTKKLNQQINSNRIDIEILKEKIILTRQKLFTIGNIDKKVRVVTEDNIELWEDQIDIHRKIINICDLRLSSLVQNRNELDLLNHLIKEMKKEPDANKKLKKLQTLVNEIDGNVELKINSEIDKLIRELKTGTRKKNIIQLKKQIVQLESRVS